MANSKVPKQKGVSDLAIMRAAPQWYVPVLDAGRWRQVVKQAPLAEICRQRIISYARGSQWTITATDSTETEKYQGDIEYYTQVLDGGTLLAPSQPFDTWLDKIMQDMLDLPVGGTVELTRYAPGTANLPKPYKLAGVHPGGHVSKIVNLDGATMKPTGDDQLPMMQRVNVAGKAQQVYFKRDEIGRLLYSPRPEIELKGYGMAPPELAYLAILMLYKGDTYYFKLLTDTPEAGILYVGDMAKDDAEDWLSGFRALFAGAEAMKIPVMYGEQQPSYLSFGRPPSEMTYNETLERYARLLVGAYGLRLSDVGLDGGNETLAGKIRDQAASRITGYGTAITMIENMVNLSILPPYLKFSFTIRDPEQTQQMQRARLMGMQWAKVATEAGILSPEDILAQLVKDGLFTVEVEPPEEATPVPKTEDVTAESGDSEADTAAQTRDELAKKSPEEGGRGDVTEPKKAMVIRSAAEMAMELITPSVNSRQGRIKDMDAYLEKRADFWSGEADGTPIDAGIVTKAESELLPVCKAISEPNATTIMTVLLAVAEAAKLKNAALTADQLIERVTPFIDALK